jgi:hypothetical protein
MTENFVLTRSKVVRSPPTVRKLLGQTTLPPKRPVRAHGSHSSPETSILEDFNNSCSQPIAAAGRDDGAIMNALAMLTNKIDDLKQSVLVIQQDVVAVKQELKDVFASQIAEHTEQLASHDARLDDVESSIRELQNNAEAATKAADLIIKGIPLLSTDNPVNLYFGVASALGFDQNTTPAAEVFRLGKKKSGSSFDPPILVKFTRLLDKNEFFRRYFRHKNLNLSEIGFPLHQRIYITENLTKQDQEIHGAAMKLRSERKLYSVSTSKGAVLVRWNKDDRPVRIRAVSELMENTDIMCV